MIAKVPIKYMALDIPEGAEAVLHEKGREITLKCVDGKILYIDPGERCVHPNKKYGYWREWKNWKGWSE